MILINYLSIKDLNNYRKEFTECLLHNNEIPTIKEIFVFCEASFKNLPNKGKIKYIVKQNYSEADIINYTKKISKENRIIWSKVFVKFNTDLIKLKSSETVFEKKNEYIIFNRKDIVNNGLNSLISEKPKGISSSNLSKEKNKPKISTKSLKSKKIVSPVKRTINKAKKEIIKTVESKIKKIDVILVSVNYNNYLEKSLYHNTKIFDNIKVVTHSDDLECISICKKYKVDYLLVDEIVKDKTINKSLGLNKAIRSLKDPDWILIIDADIIINKEICLKNLNKEFLYTSDRYICEDMRNYKKWKLGELDIKDIGKLEHDRGIGFFQLFNYSMKEKYPDSNYGRYSESTWSDILFKKGFKNRETLELDVIHLGKPYQNWSEVNFKRNFETSVSVIEEQKVIKEDIDIRDKIDIKIDNDINVLNISKRDYNIKPKLAVITSFFNPMNYTNIKYNYLKFSEKIKEKADLFPIELSFDGEFFIDDENVTRINGNENNVLWQKEKLLNIVLSKLPKEYTNVAWIDCDILFESEKWVEEINEKLKYYKVLQLYEKSKRLDDKGNIDRLSEGAIKRISRINFVENALFGIPGFAWAMRRESIEKIGFLETQIIGGADALMYYSFFGVKDSVVHEKMNKEWKNVYLKWFDKMFNEVNNSVNYITGDIIHLYHGKMKNRNYDHRYNILSEHNFDPELDLITGENGLWEFKNKELSEKMSKYFESRNEDDNVISISDYFDNVYVLNLDRRPDRFENIKNKLDLLNIKFERFSAIDGDDILNGEYDFSRFVQGRGMLENKYALACLRSHIEIIKDAKFKGYKRILIFEDDVLISKDINIHLQKLRNIKDWKLLYLGASQYNWNVEFKEDFYHANNTLGCFAYAIDSSVYDEILESNNENYSVDNLIKKLHNIHKRECYVFYPNICISDVSESTIRGKRDQESHSKRMRWDILKNYI